MDKNQILSVVKQVRTSSPPRKFVQNFDIVFNLRNLDVKKETDKINTFITLPFPVSKRVRTTALVSPDLAVKAKGICDSIVRADEFKALDKKKIKQLARQTDFFIAEASVMPQVAATFGKILGPRGKMPNVKAGCVVQPTTDLKQAVDKLQKTIKLETKNEATLKTRVGTESAKDEEITENVYAIYNAILTALPQEKNNLKSVLLKLTMGKPVELYSATVEKEKK